jgi:hypothetical protein
VAGRYSETLERWKDGSRLTMTFQTPEGPVEVRHDHSTRLDDQPFATTNYEPYESEGHVNVRTSLIDVRAAPATAERWNTTSTR